MGELDYRADVSVAAFAAIPAEDDNPIDGYYDLLIHGNQRIDHRFFEDRELLRQLARGQQLLMQLGGFDGEVKNGGITQFFWNCQEWVFDVADGIESLGETELLANYERALEALVGKKERWLALREEWARGKDGPSWEPFQ